MSSSVSGFFCFEIHPCMCCIIDFFFFLLCSIPLNLYAAIFLFCCGWILGCLQFGTIRRKATRMLGACALVDLCIHFFGFLHGLELLGDRIGICLALID